MRSKAQVYAQTLVSKYSFLLTEDWIRESRVKAAQRLEGFWAGLDKRNVDCFVGIA